MAGNGEFTQATLSRTQINLKLIPGVDGRAEVCQLVAINLTDIVVKGSWIGSGRLHLVPHVNAPVADFPVRRVVGAHHFLADLTTSRTMRWRKPRNDSRRHIAVTEMSFYGPFPGALTCISEHFGFVASCRFNS